MTATVDTPQKAVTFGSFPLEAHHTYADKTQKKPLENLPISTQIHNVEIKKQELIKLFGNYLCSPSFASFPKAPAAGAVFLKNLTEIDIDAAFDVIQNFVDSFTELTSGIKRDQKKLSEMISTKTMLNRILEMVRGFMSQYAKG